jgi:hypothetical protein
MQEFLARFRVHPDQPSRSTIDAVTIRLIGAIWPALSMQDVEALYLELLLHAERAQSAESLDILVRHGLHLLMSTNEENWPEGFASQVLHRDMIKNLTHPSRVKQTPSFSQGSVKV